jgi:hypothetical protein
MLSVALPHHRRMTRSKRRFGSSIFTSTRACSWKKPPITPTSFCLRAADSKWKQFICAAMTVPSAGRSGRSANTPLAASDSGSQYKLAALAFDRHIAHLIRPVIAYSRAPRPGPRLARESTSRLDVSFRRAWRIACTDWIRKIKEQDATRRRFLQALQARMTPERDRRNATSARFSSGLKCHGWICGSRFGFARSPSE